MAFFQSAVGTLQTLVVALGAGLGIWGAINLIEGYGNDNPGAKSQGMKQLMAGGGVALIGTTLADFIKSAERMVHFNVWIWKKQNTGRETYRKRD